MDRLSPPALTPTCTIRRRTRFSRRECVSLRLYHSGSLLLPDGTVALMGGNPTRGSYEQHIEILLSGVPVQRQGSPALRPTITSASDTMYYGHGLQVQTPDVGQIESVVPRPTRLADACLRYGPAARRAVVHQGVGFVDGDRAASRQHRATGLLHALHPQLGRSASLARFVRLATGTPANQAPTAAIDSPSSNMTIDPGGSISFAGSGSDPDGNVASYAWTFDGGSPAASTEAAPGAVTYSTPGSYSASLIVTDDAGAASVAATRTITVADFSLSATPASRSVLPGAGTTYTATVGADRWLHGQRRLRRTRPPLWRQRILHTCVGVERGLDDARGVDERVYPDRYLHADRPRHERPDYEEHDRHAHCGCREPGARCDHHQPVIEHDHQSRRVDLVRRLRLRSRRGTWLVRLDLRRRQSGREQRGSTRSRDLLHAGQLFGVAHRDRQRRRRQRCRHANDHGRQLLTLGHACVPQRPAGRGHDVHRHGGANRWLHRQRQLRRPRPPLWRQRILHTCVGVERGFDDARGVDERVYTGRYLHAHHPRHERSNHEEHDRHAHCGWKLFDLRLAAEPNRTQEREHDLRGHAGSRKRVHGYRDVLDQLLAEERHRAVLAKFGHHIGNDDIDARHQEERRSGNVHVDGQRHQQRAGPLGADHVDGPVAMPITRRSLLGRLGAGAAAAAAAPTLAEAALQSVVAPVRSPGGMLRLNRTENGYGPSPRVIRALQEAVATATQRHPEYESDALQRRLASLHGVMPDRIVLGCGSTEVLRMAADAFLGPRTKVVTALPTFDVLGRFAEQRDAVVVAVPLTDQHAHNLERMLTSVDAATRLVYICNPNNPTGTLTRRQDLEAFLHEAAAGHLRTD